MPGLRTINVNRVSIEGDPGQERLRGIGLQKAPISSATDLTGPARLGAGNVEAASRAALQIFLEDAGSATLKKLTSPRRAEQVPDMRIRASTATPDLAASTVVFQQTAAAIPVFGGRLTVDLDNTERSFLGINGQVAPLPDLNPVAELSPRRAAEMLAEWAGRSVEPDWLLRAPVLTWYHDDEAEQWHLAYHFKALPVTPPDDSATSTDAFSGFGGMSCMHGGSGPGGERYDFLVDANNGTVRYYYGVRPAQSIPVSFDALDCANVQRQIFCENRQNVLVLRDPLRNIETYDYDGGDLAADPAVAFPATPIATPPSPAAVSAHHHARIVFDFFNDVLKRDGIDDKGMNIVSVINVRYSRDNPAHPRWRNAVWYQGRMWYGEDVSATSGGLPVSLAMHLDVIAHELTHGVTETSSGLVYRDLPGALNESFSDIFGVMIANWFPAAPEPVTGWNWEIGPGLGNEGGPIRDMSDPSRTGQPAHMREYVKLPESRDHGGVHIYSGIHNKAVHNLLTATEPDGDASFPPQEAALLLYLTLVRLTPTSDFKAARRTLENVTSVFYANDPARRARRLAGIGAAYGGVGIQ